MICSFISFNQPALIVTLSSLFSSSSSSLSSSSSSSIPSEYALVELLFQLLLQQPNSSLLSALICRLVLELCKKDSTRYPPVVALAANTVFQLVPELDSLSSREFGQWFAFHLLNTNMSETYS